jgi:hypothetical protein
MEGGEGIQGYKLEDARREYDTRFSARECNIGSPAQRSIYLLIYKFFELKLAVGFDGHRWKEGKGEEVLICSVIQTNSNINVLGVSLNFIICF